MLSRVAENIYWMGRYLERAENTARLVNVTTNLLLDQPGLGEEYGWRRLITITGSAATYEQSGRKVEERDGVEWLLSSGENLSSLVSSLGFARENLRCMRAIFPHECWESINDLSIFVREHGERGNISSQRTAFLAEVIRHCQTVVGILIGTLSRGPAFNFFRMGQHMERADMCTRLLDIEPVVWQTGIGRDTLWLSLLRSVSGEHMYRHYVNPRINAVQVVSFLLKDRAFPRSFNYCLREVERCLRILDNSALCEQVIK
ncbi:alpha-E domain-containing protein, partial [Candidatus Magnetaquicoccus inordinatus]|uniref:alpha-E domain-containing protein n=1 Tax=Candidatus Magnetaquicoccus inordinatus TaxID=2496818 RepID=UPI00102D1FCC